MAKFVQKTDMTLVALASSFKTFGTPLRDDEIFYGLEEAQRFAASDAAYVGQIVTVIQNSMVVHYSVQVDSSLKAIGEDLEFMLSLQNSVEDPLVQDALATDPTTEFVVAFRTQTNADGSTKYLPYFKPFMKGDNA